MAVKLFFSEVGFISTLLGVACFGTVLGCNGGRPDRVQVSGRVLVDGEPMSIPEGAFAYIQFHPGRRPSGKQPT